MSSDTEPQPRRSVLAVIAHPDDLELMAGGAVAKWVRQGHAVHVLTLTDGVWKAPSNETMRVREDALQEEAEAAAHLGFTVENLGLQAMDLRFSDALVVEVLRRIEARGVDTLLCPWDRDVHHDHEIVARVAMSASRRVPRVLMGQINYYTRDFFAPNVFVDISDTWDAKIAALEMYRSQWSRAGSEWLPFLDDTTRHYGRIVGVARAEGFISRKLLL